ncbi:MAG: hydrogenase iron-sulfur subunit [Candidatus Helarchaeales archaeon]
MKLICKMMGIDPARLSMHFVSAAEGARFAEIATEMTETVARLGPNPLKKNASK